MLLLIMQTTQKWECAAVSYFLKCDYHCIFRVRLADRMIPESRHLFGEKVLFMVAANRNNAPFSFLFSCVLNERDCQNPNSSRLL